jgi:hypothetical protein
MAGRRREEQAAEGLRKPVSGTVAGGVGTAGVVPGNRYGRRETGDPWTPFPHALEGHRTPGEEASRRSVVVMGDATRGGFFEETVEERRTPGEDVRERQLP